MSAIMLKSRHVIKSILQHCHFRKPEFVNSQEAQNRVEVDSEHMKQTKGRPKLFSYSRERMGIRTRNARTKGRNWTGSYRDKTTRESGKGR